MDNIFAGLQPTNGTEPPAEPIVETPPAPEPPAPTDTGVGSESADDAEWNKALEELFPGVKGVNEDKHDEQTNGNETGEEAGAGEAATAGKKPDAQQGDGTVPPPAKPDNADAGTDDNAAAADADKTTEPPEPTDALTRLTAREQQAAVDSVKSEIREKLFKDVPTQLRDKDGDPLDSIDKVMAHLNPNTGQPFTEEEAGLWLLRANQEVKDNIANIDRQVEQIANTNLMLKDEADVINFEYGELLRAMPELRQQLWETYSTSFKTDTKTGIIMEAPKSLRQFYETMLEPYAALARSLEADAGAQATQAAVQQQAQAQQQQRQAQAKVQRRQDRSDIYGGGNVDNLTDDEREWGAAAQAVFGDQLK